METLLNCKLLAPRLTQIQQTRGMAGTTWNNMYLNQAFGFTEEKNETQKGI